jgi:hypothetical protein
LYDLGERRGDNAALRHAVDVGNTVLEHWTRERAPLAWAMTQNNLGTALSTLGERGDDDALRRAVAAYEAALEELSRYNAAAYIAIVTGNLARARDRLTRTSAMQA